MGGGSSGGGKVDNPNVINGREYSNHALEQMEEGLLTPSVIESTIQNGNSASGKNNTNIHYDPVNNVTVVTASSSGRVVTAHKGAPSKGGE